MLQYVLPCVSVWHDHLSVLIISLLLFMQGDFGYHWYCGVLPLTVILIFMCKWKCSYVNTSIHFFLPRLLATEDKPVWPKRKEWEHLESKKVFKAFCFLDSPYWTAVSSSRTGLCPRLDLSRVPLTATVNIDCVMAAILRCGQGTQDWSVFALWPIL